MDTLTVTDPSNGTVLRQVDVASYTRFEDSLSILTTGFPTWRLRPVEARVAYIEALINRLRQQSSLLAQVQATELGTPLAQCLTEIEQCLELCYYYQETACDYLADEALGEQTIIYEPLGSILISITSASPLLAIFRSVLPTLLAGNVVLLLFPANTYLSVQTARHLFDDFPDNVLQLGLYSSGYCVNMVTQPSIKGVSFHGNNTDGQAAAVAAAKSFKPALINTGGRNGYYVHEDANLADAIHDLAVAGLRNNGQCPLGVHQIFLHETIAARFEEKFIEQLSHTVVDNPQNENTELGPLYSDEAVNHLSQQVAELEKLGATCLYRGEQPKQGFYFPITVLNLPSHLTYQEALHGPVFLLTTVTSSDEAIEKINAMPFGLSSGIFMQAFEAAYNLAYYHSNVGLCHINRILPLEPHLPYGGTKKSGIGREMSVNGLINFCNIKVLTHHDYT